MSTEKEPSVKSAKKDQQYKILSETDFKLNKTYLVRNPVNNEVEEVTPKGGLLAQASKFSGYVVRGLALSKSK